jgi:hypothetical protein
MSDTRQPELKIEYVENGVPTKAVCSLCGEWMYSDPKVVTSAEAITRFAAEFEIHVRMKHRYTPS